MTRILAVARRWRLFRDTARIALAMDPGDSCGSLTAGGTAADGSAVTWTTSRGGLVEITSWYAPGDLSEMEGAG